MKKKRFTEQQIAYALRLAERGTRAVEVCRKLGISEPTFYAWKKKYAGMGVMELRRVKQLEEENQRLKQVVAELSLKCRLTKKVWLCCSETLAVYAAQPIGEAGDHPGGGGVVLGSEADLGGVGYRQEYVLCVV